MAKKSKSTIGQRKYPAADVKILYGLAAARCSVASCRKDVVLGANHKDKTKQIGKIAHIVAHGNDGPRADPSYPKDKLDTYENWILLCGTCHDTVDAHHNTYTVDSLRKVKQEHEDWVRNQLSVTMALVTFAELEVVTKAILASNENPTQDFTIIKPLEKMERNGLTDNTGRLITMGLSQGHQVEQFIIELSKIDNAFSMRLIKGFQDKYAILCQEGLNGDALFQAMFDFAAEGNKSFTEKSAALAVLCHLFVVCEIFEK